MVDSSPELAALHSAIACAGSQSKLARALGVSSTAVWKWVRHAKRMPAEFVIETEILFGVSRHDLRPDIYPVEDAQPRKAVGA